MSNPLESRVVHLRLSAQCLVSVFDLLDQAAVSRQPAVSANVRTVLESLMQQYRLTGKLPTHDNATLQRRLISIYGMLPPQNLPGELPDPSSIHWQIDAEAEDVRLPNASLSDQSVAPTSTEGGLEDSVREALHKQLFNNPTPVEHFTKPVEIQEVTQELQIKTTEKPPWELIHYLSMEEIEERSPKDPLFIEYSDMKYLSKEHRDRAHIALGAVYLDLPQYQWSTSIAITRIQRLTNTFTKWLDQKKPKTHPVFKK